MNEVKINSGLGLAAVPKRNYIRAIRKIGMLAVIKSVTHGAWRVAFSAGAGAAVLLICVVACVFTLISALPRIQAR